MNKLMLRHTMDKPLPYDAEVEYLESSGTQYIDTGITCNTDTDVLQVTFSISSFVSFCGVAGYRVGASDHNFAIGYNKNNVMSADCNNSNYANSRAQISDVVANTDYTIIISRQGRYIYKGDSLVDSNTSTSDIFTTGDIYIFAVNGIQDNSQIRVKNVQIKRNGEEYMTLIPVRKGNTGYLYDKVSRQLFGNQGTGDFVVGPDYNPFAYQYLTFVPLEDSTFSFAKRGTGNDIEYSIDGGAWTSLASEANTPTVAAGHNIRWKGQLVAKTDGGEFASSNGIGNFVATGNFKVCGNVMSLIYKDNFVGQDELLHNFQFSSLLSGMRSLISAKDLVLPAMILTQYCYWAMFSGCTNLTDAPELPATSLPGHCYRNMFFNCTSLTAGPTILPGTPSSTSNYYHYLRMFKGCTSLVTAPVISSTQWGHSSCNEMFYGCTSLVTAPALSVTTLQDSCYANMFYGCTSLTTAPELPATTLANSCYRNMYYNCSNLTYVKMLATNISATNCLEQWVSGVASTGTFVKNAAMTTLPTGESGIPDGWTVIDDPSTINS